MTVLIGECANDDLPGILAIYNHAILTSAAVFSDTPVTLDERRAWLAAKHAQGYPVLVARDDRGEVAGFATFGPFRSWPGYRHTVEHSLYVREDARGQGIGSTLLKALIAVARVRSAHVLIAGVEATNAPSIRLHERHGFCAVGILPQVGVKFGRWLDLTLLQLTLDPGAPPR